MARPAVSASPAPTWPGQAPDPFGSGYRRLARGLWAPSRGSAGGDDPAPVLRAGRPLAMIAICAGVLCLVACDKAQPPAPKSVVDAPVPSVSTSAARPAGDTSVPPAASVLSATGPAETVKPDPNQGRSNSTMSATQESTAMPMPGQNNDHSAPLGAASSAKGASSAR